MPEPANRATLFRFLGWFALANSLVLALIGLRYFSGFSTGGTVLSWVYLLLIYSSHHVLLATIPLFLLLTPVVLISPGVRRVPVLAVVVYASMIAIIMLDSLLWADSRFHLNALTVQILGWQSWVFVAVIFVIALGFEALLAQRVWGWVGVHKRYGGKQIGWLFVAAIVISQCLYAWSDASYYVPVTSVGQQLPVYKGFTAKKQLTKLGLVDPQKSREEQVARRLARQLDGQLDGASDQLLNYPFNPLNCSTDQPLNLVLIMADAMRSDRVNEVDSPNMWRRAQNSGIRFTHHYSGGNSSRMGVFSLFYGLPPGYWSSFESLQRSSVLIDELQRQNYQLGLFSSSTMYRPVTLDRTAFANVPDLRLETEPADAPSWQKDEIMTGEWENWLDRTLINNDAKTQSPFFGFLFYNSTNAMDYPPDSVFGPEMEAQGDGGLAVSFSDYRKSVAYIDQLFERVMTGLESRGVLDNTVVIVTSDHGEEFGETEPDLSGHGSGYTPYQLEVPLLVFWPGRDTAVLSHRSSHYDVVPTLMRDLLGCINPYSDYAIGGNLFDATDWAWLVAGSYYNYAVLEPDQLTITFPNGGFEVRDWNYELARNPQIRASVLESVSRENTRFFK